MDEDCFKMDLRRFPKRVGPRRKNEHVLRDHEVGGSQPQPEMALTSEGPSLAHAVKHAINLA